VTTNVNATGLRIALWRCDLGTELPHLAGCRRSQMAIYSPFLGKRNDNLTGLKFQELKDRQFLRFCGQSDVLCNDRPVIARRREWYPFDIHRQNNYSIWLPLLGLMMHN